jgi:hypothetical protein
VKAYPPTPHRRSGRAWYACAIAALVALAPGVVADDAQAQDQAALAKARQQFQQAIAAQAAGNWAGALSLLREVAAVRMTPQVRYNIALSEENLGQLVAALGNYELAATSAKETNATDVERVVAARLEPLRARIPKLVVERTESARLATISVDGVQLGSSMIGKELPLDPGAHVVEATARGHKPFSETFDIEEKELKTLQVVLVPLTAEVEPAEAGKAQAPIDQGPERSPSVLPYVVGGVGVASLAASGIFYMLRGSTMSDLDSVCGPNRDDCPADSEATFDKGKTYTTLSNVTLGLGIVGVGAGVVLYLTDSGPSTEPAGATIGVSPSGPNASMGATFVGRF